MLEQVPELAEHKDYSKRFKGAKNGDFRAAFFHGFANKPLGQANGSEQLLILYLAYLCIRVTMRCLKLAGVTISDSMTFLFSWESAGLDEDMAKDILQVLNYSNVFLDWRRMSQQKKAYDPKTNVIRYTLMNAAAHKSVRLHGVRKDSWVPKQPLPSVPYDHKYCCFREHLDKCKNKKQRAELTSIWITTRSKTLMGDYMSGKPAEMWSSTWLSEIKFMSRDRGQSRETPATCLRAKNAILKIQGESAKKEMEWTRVAEILEDKELLSDWGPFKNQHLVWNLYLTGDLTLRGDVDSWEDLDGLISDRATTQLPERFVGETIQDCFTSPARSSTAQAPPQKRARKDTGSYEFPDLFGEKEVRASTYTLMKHVDRSVFDMREAIDVSTVQVGIRTDSAEAYTWHSVSLCGAVSEDQIDGRFNVLSNFCQLERLLKVWSPKMRSEVQ